MITKLILENFDKMIGAERYWININSNKTYRVSPNEEHFEWIINKGFIKNIFNKDVRSYKKKESDKLLQYIVNSGWIRANSKSIFDVPKFNSKI